MTAALFLSRQPPLPAGFSWRAFVRPQLLRHQARPISLTRAVCLALVSMDSLPCARLSSTVEGMYVRVDIVADQGSPERGVAAIIAGHKDSDLELKQLHRQIPLRTNGELDLQGVKEWARDDEADFLIIVTEIPRRAGGQPTISSIHIDEDLAVISMPALGVFRARAKLEKVLKGSIEILKASGVDAQTQAALRPFRVEQAEHPEYPVIITAPSWVPGRILLVMGMVAINEPLKTLPKMTGALAAAAATGAFGIFYSTIWQMADALPAWRLGLITVTVILLMSVWLITSNRLWEQNRRYGSLTEAAMYNASVVLSILMSVSLLYIALFAGIFLTGLVVIEAGYMEAVIGEEVTYMNYVDIAWLAASMGTVAGSLGSNFDSEADIRRLTQGRREALRMNDQDD